MIIIDVILNTHYFNSQGYTAFICLMSTFFFVAQLLYVGQVCLTFHTSIQWSYNENYEKFCCFAAKITTKALKELIIN